MKTKRIIILSAALTGLALLCWYLGTLVPLRAADGTLWKKTWAGTVPWKQGDVVEACLQIQDPVLFSDKDIKEDNK